MILEFQINKNRRIIFEEDFWTITREDALKEKSKKYSLKYSEVKDVVYSPAKINWFGSCLKFIVLFALDSVNTPIYGQNGQLVI
jgi:hypothetical protein